MARLSYSSPFRHRSDPPDIPEIIKPKTLMKAVNDPITRRRKKQRTAEEQCLTEEAKAERPIPAVRKGWYTDDEKLNACAVYAAVGNITEVSRLTGINALTLRDWTGTEWWGEVLRKIRFQLNDQLDSKMTKIIDKALDSVMERITDGDYYVDKKTGKVKQIPMKGRDLAVVSTTILDKRQLIRGEPTNISAKQSNADTRLEALAEEFAKFVKARTIEVSTTTVESEPALAGDGEMRAPNEPVQESGTETTTGSDPEDRGEVAPEASSK